MKKKIRGKPFKRGKKKTGGRKKGTPNQETINREKALVEYQQQMLRMMKTTMIAQLQAAQGLSVVLRPKLVKNPKTKKLERSGEMAQVKDPDEIIRLLEADERGEVIQGQDYHIIFAKDPNVKAIRDILEFLFGRPPESLKVEHKGKVILLDK